VKIEVDPARLKHTKWYEYLLRFVFGGLITAAAGWISKQYGPAYGGLFLAFPAILPASLTLIEKHESEDSHRAKEAKDQAGEDSLGAALGSVAMLAFALVIWLLDLQSPWALVLIAFVVWLAVAPTVWICFEFLSGRSKTAGLEPKGEPASAQPRKSA